MLFVTMDEVCGEMFDIVGSVPSDVRCFLCGGSFCPPRLIYFNDKIDKNQQKTRSHLDFHH